MTYKTHMAGGLLISTAAFYFIKQDIHPINTQIMIGAPLIITSIISSILPDIDEKNSKIGHMLWFISWPLYLLKSILKLLSYTGISIFRNLSKQIGHRKLTHYPLTWFILSCMAAGAGRIVMNYSPSNYFTYAVKGFIIGFSLGYLSHLILDLISGKIPLLGPFSPKKYGTTLIKTGGFLEFVFLIICYIATYHIITKF